MRHLLCGLLTLAALTTTTAAADTIDPLRIATDTFGPAPCGTPTITVMPVPLEYEGRRYAGLAWFDRCRIELDPGHWYSMPPRRRCDLIVHEYGHLVGVAHSDNPDDVMYPDAYGPVFRPCRPQTRSRATPRRARST